MHGILRGGLNAAPASLRALIGAHDWRDSPLGHPDDWPPQLATAVAMALDSALPMFIAWGPDLRMLYNDAYVPILGERHPRALGEPLRQVWADAWAQVVPFVDRALSGKRVHFEDLLVPIVRNGAREEAYFTFSYAPLHDGAGSVAGMYCTAVETTERLRAERRAALELKLSDALRPLHAPAAVLDTASALLGEELRLARVLYCEVDAADGSFATRRQWLRPGTAALSRERFRLDDFGPEIGAALRAGETVVIEDAARDPRTLAWPARYREEAIGALVTVPLVRAGRLTAFLSINHSEPHRWSHDDIRFARDTAERTWAALDGARAQAELRAERDRSRYIFDTIAEGFSLLDARWRIVEMNAEGLRICNMAAEQVIGQDHWELFPEVDGSEAGRMLRRVMRERSAGQAEFHLPRSGGRGGWNEIRAFPMRDGGIAIFFRDITDRKLVEEKLRAADQRKDEFLAMLAHELRNPLAPIKAAALLLDMGVLNDTRVRQSSAIIGRQVRHMTRLVDDLLDVSRVTRGLIVLDKTLLDVRGIVDEAVEQVRPALLARRQRLGLHLPGAPVSVEGDRARLVQVISNLLGNAVKYTPEEGAIDVHVQQADGFLRLDVSDDGIGMEPDLTESAFDLFAQGKRSNDRSQGGLGLGLALVRNLVELHGGSVGCASPGPGRGSTFTVRLPLAAAPQPQGQGAGTPARGERLKLMVVDDNVDAAETLAMLLEAAGHEVVVEHDSRRAIERARLAPPDACLLDIGLPEIDGNELARRLRAQAETADCVLIAVSGYGQEQDRRRAMEAGFSHHLVKPVDFEQLAELLAEVRGTAVL